VVLIVQTEGNSAPKSDGVPDVVGVAIQGARSEQQDAHRLRWIENEDAWLLVLADGMGGYAGGATASRIAVDGFVATFVSKRNSGSSLEDAFQSALDDVNLRIAKAQESEPDLSDMGTTIAAAHLSKAGVAWISVGDSPIWILRDNNLHRLNEDHSMREIVGDGKKLSNMLQSVVNGKPIPMIDCKAAPVVVEGGVLLIASDGILTLGDDEIAATVRQCHPRRAQGIADALLDAVSKYRKSNQDNCSLIVALPAQEDTKDSPRSGQPVASLSGVVRFGAFCLAGCLVVLALYFMFLAL
jgi:serine/threonine protein phosphatase PrpC